MPQNIPQFNARLLHPAVDPVAVKKLAGQSEKLITKRSASLRTMGMSTMRMIRFPLSRSSSGRISPLKRLPSNAIASSWIGP